MGYIELIIFDDDGPEGFYKSLKFERSYQAVEHIIAHYSSNLKDYNFIIKNHYNE